MLDQVAPSQLPLALDQLAQINRCHDLKRAGQDRPGCNKIDRRLRRDARPQEGEHAGGDARQSLEQQRPPVIKFVAVKQAHDQGQEAVYRQALPARAGFGG